MWRGSLAAALFRLTRRAMTALVMAHRMTGPGMGVDVDFHRAFFTVLTVIIVTVGRHSGTNRSTHASADDRTFAATNFGSNGAAQRATHATTDGRVAGQVIDCMSGNRKAQDQED